MENFDKMGYRDNLAKDLKDIRKDDPEMAQTVLHEEQQTSRYKTAEKFNVDERPDRVEFFKELRSSIKEGKLDKYFDFKNSSKIYKDGTLAEVLNFSKEELREIAKKLTSMKVFLVGICYVI